MKKVREYEAEGIVVEFEPRRCIHAAECVKGLPEVFDADAKPWVQPDKGDPDAIVAAVAQCPSGALQTRRIDGGESEVGATENTIRVIPDGPVYVRGRIRIHMPDGEVREETRVALCRCGESGSKPYCDNTHQGADFVDPGAAPDHKIRAIEGFEGDGALDVRLAANGPLLLEGPVRVVPAVGDPAEGEKCALCRCGASSVKPYCDGTHKTSGFTAE